MDIDRNRKGGKVWEKNLGWSFGNNQKIDVAFWGRDAGSEGTEEVDFLNIVSVRRQCLYRRLHFNNDPVTVQKTTRCKIDKYARRLQRPFLRPHLCNTP